jgi:hypothetical protein
VADLTAADFEAGSRYRIALDGGEVEMTIEQVSPIPHSPREGGGFRMELLGPVDPLLPQGIYSLAGNGAAHDIFIVPVGRDSGGTRYEAIFN